MNNECLKEYSQPTATNAAQAGAGLYEIFIEEQWVASGLINQAKKKIKKENSILFLDTVQMITKAKFYETNWLLQTLQPN